MVVCSDWTARQHEKSNNHSPKGETTISDGPLTCNLDDNDQPEEMPQQHKLIWILRAMHFDGLLFFGVVEDVDAPEQVVHGLSYYLDFT